MRLADVFLSAGAWPAALGLLNLLPRSYLRVMADDCEADPDLADRALRVGRWLREHAALTGVSEG